MENKRHIVAPDGMVLTNGETFATELWLGDGDNAENWQEITVEEADKLQEIAFHENQIFGGGGNNDHEVM